MDKYTINRNILLVQMIISTLFLGGCTYFIFPMYDGDKEMIGFYYSITTILSFLVCILVEFFMRKIYDWCENSAKTKAIKSDSSEEHEAYKNRLAKEQRDKYISDYRQKYDKNS